MAAEEPEELSKPLKVKFEDRTAAVKPETLRMAGHNNGGYENRAVQHGP